MKYPNGIKPKKQKNIVYANRGMNLEKEINESNTYYLNNDIAVIYKKPTPITITKVDYPGRNKAIIKEAFFATPSTTDYNGIYKGKYIDFDAKETKNKTSFPLSNVHPHQIEHLKRIYNQGGIGFLLIRFTTLNETYILTIDKILDFLKTEKKSIPYSYIKENGYFIKETYIPRVDYLKVIDKIYFGGNYE